MTDPRDTIPGYRNPFDRSKGYKFLCFKDSHYLGAHEVDHLQEILRDGMGRIGSAILANGYIASGGIAVKGEVAGGKVTYRLSETEIFLIGSMHDIPAAEVAIPSTGSHTIGVRMHQFTVDHTVDPNLKGIAPGTRAEGEPMADAFVQLGIWSWDGDEAAGDFFPIFQITDGDIVKEPTAQQNDAFTNLLRRYDRDRNENYIVEGCGVTALGLKAGTAIQEFSIAEGVVNVWGYKYHRPTSTRHVEIEEPDIELIENEPHTLTGNAPYTIALRYSPLLNETGKQPATIMVTRQKTVTMTHGAYSGIADTVPDPTIFKIISVKSGNTTYKEGEDFLLTADTIDWRPDGQEPRPGDTYQATYHYTATVAPDAFTSTSITVNDGVEGSVAYLTYRYKMPRWDAIAITRDGIIEYVKGISSRLSPQKAYVGGPRMKLADVWNIWGSKPLVKPTGVIRITVEQERDMETRLSNAEISIAELRLKNDISSREPVSKRGLFADPLIDDTYRDQGTPQTAAVFGGSMVLPITASASYMPVPTRTLPYTEDIIVEQGFITSSMKINPYQAFPAPVPAASLDPAVDIWSVTETVWTSEITRRFYEFVSYYWDPNPGTGPAGHGWSTSSQTSSGSEKMGSLTTAIEFIRERDVSFTLTNFGPGETLTEVLFDGVPVTP